MMRKYNVKIEASQRGAIGLLYTEKRELLIAARDEDNARDEAHTFATFKLNLDHVRVTSIEEA